MRQPHLKCKGGVFISAYQRIVWFHNKVVQEWYPNAGKLAEQFEISLRQAQRDIEYMRDSMNAPLVYCALERGYRYENTFVLPSFFLSEAEKETVSMLAEQYRKLGTFGYEKYKRSAGILSKISVGQQDNKQEVMKSPFIAEIEMLGDRTSTAPLDFFLCEKVVGQTYTYAFFDPDVFISVLIASHLEFRIVKPNWLREYMKERLSHLLMLI